jgi:Cdc6-like AAA superfamily ATPase
VKVSPADDLLAQARVALVAADRSSDLRGALVAVREALEITTRLSEELRQIAADTAMYRGGSG